MPPRPQQTVWRGNNTYWSLRLLELGSNLIVTNPMYDAGITGPYLGRKPHQLSRNMQGALIELLLRALQVKAAFIPHNIHSNHSVYSKIDLTTDSQLLNDPLSSSGQTQSSQIRLLTHHLAQWLHQVKWERTSNLWQLLRSSAEPLQQRHRIISFQHVTTRTQRDGFQCALYCIGNITAEASGAQGRVDHITCERICKYVGLFLWLNPKHPISLLTTNLATLQALVMPDAITDMSI